MSIAVDGSTTQLGRVMLSLATATQALQGGYQAKRGPEAERLQDLLDVLYMAQTMATETVEAVAGQRPADERVPMYSTFFPPDVEPV